MESKGKKCETTAAALKYDPQDQDIPILAALGHGHVAQKIINKANEAGVPVMPDADLASMLAKMSVGDEIPPQLYEVVAKVLLFVSELDKEYSKKLKKATTDQ